MMSQLSKGHVPFENDSIISVNEAQLTVRLEAWGRSQRWQQSMTDASNDSMIDALDSGRVSLNSALLTTTDENSEFESEL